MKTLVMLRGVSGSGKSTVAEYIQRLPDVDEGRIIQNRSADDYFVSKITNEYNFDASKLHLAHQDCINNVKKDMILGYDIIVSNTSTTEKELKPYLELAAEYDYKVISLVVENRHGNQNVHGVPDETLKKQESRLRNSIKLL